MSLCGLRRLYVHLTWIGFAFGAPYIEYMLFLYANNLFLNACNKAVKLTFSAWLTILIVMINNIHNLH